MQWGVLQDFADSVEYYIEIEYQGENVWNYSIYCPKTSLAHHPFKTRPEARTAAIEKFNELYNKNNVT